MNPEKYQTPLLEVIYDDNPKARPFIQLAGRIIGIKDFDRREPGTKVLSSSNYYIFDRSPKQYEGLFNSDHGKYDLRSKDGWQGRVEIPEGVGTYTQIMEGEGKTILDLACGGARAIRHYAVQNPQHNFIAGDLAMHESIAPPPNSPENITFLKMDWNQTGLEDSSIDAILSLEGALRYEYNMQGLVSELSRIARPGCVLRATDRTKRALVGDIAFCDVLVQHGWLVYEPSGKNSITIGVYEGK